MGKEEGAVRKLLAIAVGLFVAIGAMAGGAEIKIISAKAAGLFLGELAPQFERVTGNRVTICSTPTECDATGRKLPQQDRSHKRWREANGGAQCGKSACCVVCPQL